jgi:hypothetical protein
MNRKPGDFFPSFKLMTSMGKPLTNGISIFLGVMMLVFGVLKFFDPINGWYRSQIVLGGLPSISYYPGMLGEITVGLLFLLPVFFKDQLTSSKKKMYLVASTMLIFMMIVAVYVHLQPGVPADVLPLKIKLPFIPVFVMALAAINLLYAYQREISPGRVAE